MSKCQGHAGLEISDVGFKFIKFVSITSPGLCRCIKRFLLLSKASKPLQTSNRKCKQQGPAQVSFVVRDFALGGSFPESRGRKLGLPDLIPLCSGDGLCAGAGWGAVFQILSPPHWLVSLWLHPRESVAPAGGS